MNYFHIMMTRAMPGSLKLVLYIIEMKGITRCKLTIISESAVHKKFLGQSIDF
jgi:hypothetical protein